MKKIIIISLLCFFITGCATVPIGTSTQDWRIKKSGMAADVKPHGNIIFPGKLEVIDEKKSFKTTDEKAVWWCELRSNSFAFPPTMLAKWHSPDGALYKEEKITSFSISEAIRAELPIRGTDIVNIQGKWKVEIYSGNKKFDEIWFVIGELKEQLKQMGEE